MRAFDALEFGRPKRHSPPIRGAVRGSVGRTVRLGAHRRRWTLLCVLAYCIDTPSDMHAKAVAHSSTTTDCSAERGWGALTAE